MTRRAGACVVCIAMTALGPACRRDPAAPTPPPPLPTGQPNAKALDNLVLVRRLEHDSRSQSILVTIGANGVTLDGTLGKDTSWNYIFADVVGNNVNLYEWFVRDTGRIQLEGPFPPNPRGPLDVTELGPFLRIDSDRAVQLGLQYGADAFAARHPHGFVVMNCRFQGRLLVWQMAFSDTSSGVAICEVPIYLNAQTGELLARDLSCQD